MPFAERYLNALNSSNLQDDELHKQTEVLAAAALADLTGGSGSVFGSMLSRAKYADPVQHKTFESGNHSLAVLLKVWKRVVAQRGLERSWFPRPRAEWDANAVFKRYEQIAEQSLAHWLGGNCDACNGTTLNSLGLSCKVCNGTGAAPILGDNVVADRTRDMTSELEGLFQSHSARAGAKMRKAA
jgi:hypothetical protein